MVDVCPVKGAVGVAGMAAVLNSTSVDNSMSMNGTASSINGTSVSCINGTYGTCTSLSLNGTDASNVSQLPVPWFMANANRARQVTVIALNMTDTANVSPRYLA